MASSPLPAPPGQDPGASAGAAPPTAPLAVTPAPAQPNPQMQQAMGMVVRITAASRALSQQFPELAPLSKQVDDIARQMLMKVSQNQQPGEPAAPPVG